MLIRNNEELLNEVMDSKNARTLFVETFLCKLDEYNETSVILHTTCQEKHKFENYIRQASASIFNLFAKNVTNEINDEIHKDRKRDKVSNDEEKRDKSSVKQKKLKSN